VKRFSWIITLPFLAIGVIFAVVNREAVAVSLWPFAVSVQAPLFLVILGALFVGFLLGGVASWAAAGGRRRAARGEHRRARDLESEIRRLKRAEDAEAGAARPGDPLLPARDDAGGKA
jgi:uncharacterized integral membrane protein